MTDTPRRIPGRGATIVIAATALALTSFALGDYDLSWSTFDAGGGTATGGALVIEVTLGQPDASARDALTSTSFSLTGGFWAVTEPCAGDIDGTGEVGFSDLVAVLAAWGPCMGCPEDIDGDGIVGFSDLLTILADWGPCP